MVDRRVLTRACTRSVVLACVLWIPANIHVVSPDDSLCSITTWKPCGSHQAVDGFIGSAHRRIRIKRTPKHAGAVGVWVRGGVWGCIRGKYDRGSLRAD
eukprot:4546865-Prymnesium_polylepis.2